MNTKQLYFNKTIKNWDEAIPLGNGDLGCLIWNKSNKLRFSIDKAGIWDCSNPPKNQPDFNYSNLKQLVKNGEEKIINQKYDDCYYNTTPTKLPTGKIIIDLGVRQNVISKLDMQTAEAELRVGGIKINSFVHAEEDFGLIQISKPNVKISAENPKFGKHKRRFFVKAFKGTVQSLKNLVYPKATVVKKKVNGICIQYFVQPTNESFYGIVTASKSYNGTTLIAYTVGISQNNDFVDKCVDKVITALNTGYENAFEQHKAWWEQYWSKSSITLPDKFMERQYNFNTYLLAGCSRKGKFPMPLQGVWTADNNGLPPWKGDYHHDLNTRMSYTSYLKANRIDEGESFIDYLLNTAEQGRAFAEEFYGVKGLCLPSVMDIEGNALGGWCQYALSPTNQLWLCCIMARHYFYTGKEDYLREKIYPYMTEVGEFLLNMLHKENGFYKLELSTSPEIHDNRMSAWLTPNSNYDLALMKAFCINMIKTSNALGKTDAAEKWTKILSDFEPLAVNENNVLMLSTDESPYESHRHHSHCMSIYPLRMMEYDTDEHKKIIDSTIANLEHFGIKNWVGYSLGWMAQLYAVQGNGDKAFGMLDSFFRYFCTDNGFHSNGDYRFKTSCTQRCRLFTLEANFLAMDAIQEMLLYSENNFIKVLPAIPVAWKDVAFENLRAYGGLLVSLKLCNGKITYLKFTAEKDIHFTLEEPKYECDFALSKEIELKQGETVCMHQNSKNSVCNL